MPGPGLEPGCLAELGGVVGLGVYICIYYVCIYILYYIILFYFILYTCIIFNIFIKRVAFLRNPPTPSHLWLRLTDESKE